MKRFSVFLSFQVLFVNIMLAQNEMSGSMTILDSVIVKKYNTDAVELNVRLSFPQADSVILYHFPEFVNSDDVYSFYKEHKTYPFDCGLIYTIEDENGKYVDAGYRECFVSCENIEDETKYYNSRWLLNKCSLKAELTQFMDSSSIEEYDMGRITVFHHDTIVKLYPLILKGNHIEASDESLEPGRYKLFLFYYLKNDSKAKMHDRSIEYTGHVFFGTMLSNQVELIIEEPTRTWWQFFKKH